MLFRCLRSGNTVDIVQQDDIARMMNFEGYEPVKETQHEIQTVKAVQAHEVAHEAPEAEVLTVAKKRGRPRTEPRSAEFVGEI